jgi:hypothetical protein
MRLCFPSALVALLATSAVSAQTLYVSVNGTGSVQQVSTGGVVAGFASGLTAPKGVAVSSSGNVYVTQTLSGSLQSLVSQITPAGTVTTFATGFLTPIGLAFDNSGSISQLEKKISSKIV